MHNSQYIKMMLGAPSQNLGPGYTFQYFLLASFDFAQDDKQKMISTTIPGATLRNEFTYQIETDKTSIK